MASVKIGLAYITHNIVDLLALFQLHFSIIECGQKKLRSNLNLLENR